MDSLAFEFGGVLVGAHVFVKLLQPGRCRILQTWNDPRGVTMYPHIKRAMCETKLCGVKYFDCMLSILPIQAMTTKVPPASQTRKT